MPNSTISNMTIYTPPADDMIFALYDVLGVEKELPDSGMNRETASAILDESAKLARDVLAPLNHKGDVAGTKLDNHEVTTAPGFKEAYAQYRESGWNSVPFPEQYGGQELPWFMAFPIQEMWQAANMSFGLCPLLNQGAVEAIEQHGSDEQKETYLPKMISGEWTGTMNLTEPQAGSDLGALKTKAEKQDDGTYKISGQKIYITYGEHDFTDNIIHLVLARTPDAPEGSKGISLFIVPKFLEDGTRNDVKCVSIEHKLGIHASPTCTMVFGDEGGATGYLIGKENEGLKYMFTMMNNARLSVGLQGVAISDRALQAAIAYANERRQGKSFETGKEVAIADHSDVKRMLLTMDALTLAGRLMTYEAAIAQDKAAKGDKAAQAKQELMTPVVKAFCTENSLEITSLGVQVHGGMGFVEETGAAQYYRDARILPIYEGTNGIQAGDLAFRKLIRDEGAAAKIWIAEGRHVCENVKCPQLRADMEDVFQALENAVSKLLKLASAKKFDEIAALSMPILNMFGYAMGGVAMAKLLNALPVLSDEKKKNHYELLVKFYKKALLPRLKADNSYFERDVDPIINSADYLTG